MKPAIPDVIARFRAYHQLPGNAAWGSLHIVMDDHNVKDAHVRACVEWARERNDPEGEQLAAVLLTMSKTQRSKLARMNWAIHPSA